MHAAGTLLSTLAAMRGDAPALVLVDDEQEVLRWSFSQLHQQTQACKHFLLQAGLRPGQQLLCICGDCPQFFAFLQASLQLGLVFVPLHPDQDHATITQVMVAEGHALTMIESSLLHSRAVQVPGRVLSFDVGSDYWLPDMSAVGNERSDHSLAGIDGSAAVQDCAALLFHSSGSSGKPKAIRYSAAQLDTFLYWQQHLFAAFPDCTDVMPGSMPSARLNVLPLMHWGGLSFCLQAHLEQRCVWLFKRFSGQAMLSAAERSECQLLMLVPAMYRELLPLLLGGNHPPNLRYCLTMGEAMPPALVQSLQALGTVQLCTAYGMSEALSGLAHGLLPWHEVPPESCGRHCFGELRLVDEQGRVAPAEGEAEGELWVRNATVLPRYSDPVLCAEKYLKGWYRSGDWFRRDAAGNYFFQARLDGMCVHNGRNVYPWQVEDVLIEHPAVAACLACPIQTRAGNRRLAVLVVATPPLVPDPGELLDFYLQQGALYAAPAHVLVQTSLPLTHSGKPDRRETSRLLQEAYNADASPR